MIAATEGVAAVLAHAQPPPIGAVFRIHLLEQDHAVDYALHVRVLAHRGEIVQQHHGAAALVEVLLQRHDLSAVAERAARQQSELGQRIDDHDRGAEAFHVGQDLLRRRRELDLGQMKHRRGFARVERLFGRHDLADRHAIERPAMGRGGRTEFLGGFRKGDVQHRLTPVGAGAHAL